MKSHPPCQVCGCQNVTVLANAVAEAIIREQARAERIGADLELDRKRGPLHDGSHPAACLVCHPLPREVTR